MNNNNNKAFDGCVCTGTLWMNYTQGMESLTLTVLMSHPSRQDQQITTEEVSFISCEADASAQGRSYFERVDTEPPSHLKGALTSRRARLCGIDDDLSTA